MTTRTERPLSAIIQADTERLIRYHEGAFAYHVICDLRDRLKACESEQERRETCILWRDLYKGEHKR